MRLDGILALEDRIYQIGEVAELFGLTTRAIRFYEEEGLVTPIRQGRGRRKYGRSEIERIDMIVSCRQVGMSMDSIAALIALRDKSGDKPFHAALAKALSDRREQIEDEIVLLKHQWRLISEWTRGRKLYGPLWDDLLTLKYLHQRYRNYLDWLVGK